MKQKRKVKSLLPQRKDRKTSFLTTLLLVLSTILCIGSASLLTSSVFAEDVTEVTFTGLNDNMEAVYNLKFVDPENLSGDGVADVYFHDNSLYISPSPVIVNVSGSDYKNEVESGVYSHILGGNSNEIHSENVTIIAGFNNLASGGKNSTILGGQHHILETGAVLIGGNRNQVSNSKEGVVLIGGINNHVIENNTNRNIFILGGENNNVNTTGENMIIGGSGVNISGSEINNIFVFSSPRPFTPMSGKTFYLNMENGVGIGTGGVPGGLAVNGAIKLSYTNATKRFCNSGNLGVIYSLDGCLIGCTKTSLVKQKTADAPFELLSLNESCKSALSGDIKNGDIFYQEEEIPETPSYTGYCTHVDFTGHTRACSTPEVYKNVIFETSIVDNGECKDINRIGSLTDSNRRENKCVFECIDGYHLVHDAENGTGCYADCNLDGKRIKHNETVTGYQKNLVLCSDGEKCETCGGKNAETLICKDGSLKFLNQSFRKPGDPSVADYKYKECTLRGGYDCLGNGYTEKLGLTSQEIEIWSGIKKPYKENSYGRLYGNGIEQGLRKITTPITGTSKDLVNNRSIITATTGTSKLARGYYQLCKDYNEKTGNTDNLGKIKNPNTSCGNPDDYYKLIGCKTGYTKNGNNCEKKCESFIMSDQRGPYNPGTILTGYKNTGVCPKECEYSVFECQTDGTRKRISGTNGKEGTTGDYKNGDCDNVAQSCPGYNVEEETYKKYNKDNGTQKKTSIYDSCQTYTLINSKTPCMTGNIKYKLTDCVTNYHTENKEYCTGNLRVQNCSNGDLPNNAEWINSGTYKGVRYTEGRYVEEWKGEWDAENAWSAVTECGWECVDYARKDGDKCVIDGMCSTEENFSCKQGYSSNQKTGDNNEGYYWDCVSYDEDDGGKTESCHLCNDGYTWDGKECVKKEYKCIGEFDDTWEQVNGIGDGATEDITRTLYKNRTEAEKHSCSYICNADLGMGYTDKYGKPECREISDICGRDGSGPACNVGDVMNQKISGDYLNWDCGDGDQIYQSCVACMNPNLSVDDSCTSNICGENRDTCAGEATLSGVGQIQNLHYWRCNSVHGNVKCMECDDGSEVKNGLCDSDILPGTYYKWTYYGDSGLTGCENLRECSLLPGIADNPRGDFAHGNVALYNTVCCHSGEYYHAVPYSGGDCGGLRFGMFDRISIPGGLNVTPLDACLAGRGRYGNGGDSCKFINHCYQNVNSCSASTSGYIVLPNVNLGLIYTGVSGIGGCTGHKCCDDKYSLYYNAENYCNTCDVNNPRYERLYSGELIHNGTAVDLYDDNITDVILSGKNIYDSDNNLLGNISGKCISTDARGAVISINKSGVGTIGYLICPYYHKYRSRYVYVYPDGSFSE